MSTETTEEPLPIFDGVTGTAKRFGLSRRTIQKLKADGLVEWRTLANKILIKQVGPGSMLALIESRKPPPKKEQSANLALGTRLSHELKGLTRAERRRKREEAKRRRAMQKADKHPVRERDHRRGHER